MLNEIGKYDPFRTIALINPTTGARLFRGTTEYTFCEWNGDQSFWIDQREFGAMNEIDPYSWLFIHWLASEFSAEMMTQLILWS